MNKNCIVKIFQKFKNNLEKYNQKIRNQKFLLKIKK